MATDVSSEPIEVIPPEYIPDVEHLVTEDDTPVDNQFSEKQMRLLTEPLYSSWAGPGEDRPFIAMANVGLFYATGRPPLVPDALLSLDVRPPPDHLAKASRSYFVWQYGKTPEVVVEVVSNREGGEDKSKLLTYAVIGIPYYAIFDPDAMIGPEVFRAFRLQARSYQRMNEPVFFPEVGLGLSLWRGGYEDFDDLTWLRWVDAAGVPVPSGLERAEAEKQRAESEFERAEIERQRAESHRQRAEAERQRANYELQRADSALERADAALERAEAERQRADALAEQLRQHGIEPLKP